MIDGFIKEICSKLKDLDSYEPDPEYTKRCEEYRNNVERDFQEEWNKMHFKWFFTKRRQNKLRNQIRLRYDDPVFYLIEKTRDDILPDQWTDSEYFGKFIDVKHIAVDDVTCSVDEHIEKCRRDIINASGCILLKENTK